MLTLIALHVAHADSLDVQFGPIADRGAARHVLVPAIGLRYQRDVDDSPLFFTTELQQSVRAVRGNVYTHSTASTRVALGVGWAHDDGKAGAHGWVGPAGVLRITGVDGAYSGVVFDPGLRAVAGASWFFSERFALRFQLGMTGRLQQVPRFDFDGNAALGVRW